MSFLMILRIALKALNRNKMRTILTMLGMIIGVGAVITMVALGRGAQATIEEQVKSAGTNLININSGNFQSAGVRQGAGMATTATGLQPVTAPGPPPTVGMLPEQVIWTCLKAVTLMFILIALVLVAESV